MSPSPSTSEWKERLGPLLRASVEDAGEAITRNSCIQRWLRTASMEAAEGLASTAPRQAEAQAHAWMVRQLNETFGPLTDAVHDLTGGHGRLALHWRPLEPGYNRIYIDFNQNFKIDLVYPLETCTSDSAMKAMDAVQSALPAGAPFPNRPNRATGLLLHKGHSLGLRLTDHLDTDGTRWQQVTLLPEDGEPISNLTPQAAPSRLCSLLTQAA